MMSGTNVSVVGLMLGTDKYILFMSVYGLVQCTLRAGTLLTTGWWLRIIALDGVESGATNNYLLVQINTEHLQNNLKNK